MSVNPKKRGRPAGASNALSGEIIIDTAKQLMQDGGKIPSLRQLATTLNVDPMALYHYFKNKAALQEAITTSLVFDIYSPTQSGDWQAELIKLSQSYLQLLDDYADLLETMLSAQVQGPVQLVMERFNLIVEPLNLSDATKHNGLSLLFDYLHGFALSMKCNRDRDCLNMSMIEGPMQLIFMALEANHSSTKSSPF